MGAPSAGSVVLVPFPFSDLSETKLRPAIVLADVGREDAILCQVTGNRYADPIAMELLTADFASGSLQRTSYARPGKLFTASGGLIVREVGILRPESLSRLIDRVIELLRTPAGK